MKPRSPFRTRTVEAIFFASILLACGSSAPAHSATDATRDEIPTNKGTKEASSAPRASAQSTRSIGASSKPQASAPRCRLTVTEAKGCGPSDVEALIEPARTRLEPCLGSTGGKIRVRVRDAEGKLTFDIEPGSSLDATQKQCVLEALTTIHDDGARPPWTGATVRPTGFTSLITLEW